MNNCSRAPRRLALLAAFLLWGANLIPAAAVHSNSPRPPQQVLLLHGSRQALATNAWLTERCTPRHFLPSGAIVTARPETVRDLNARGISHEILGGLLEIEKLLWVEGAAVQLPARSGRLLHRGTDGCLVATIGRLETLIAQSGSVQIKALQPLAWRPKVQQTSFQPRLDAALGDPLIEELVARVDTLELRQTIGDLQAFGSRLSYAPGIDDAAEYLVGRLGTLGLTVELQDIELANGAALLHCDFATPLRGITVGLGPAILHTSNAGSNWQVASIPSDDDPNGLLQYLPATAVDMLDENEAWVGMAFGYLLHTTDGGSNWEILYFGNSGIYVFWDLEFIDAQTGWALAWDNDLSSVIYKTTNGGVSWLVKKTFDAVNLTKLQFTDADNAWTAGVADSSGARIAAVAYRSEDTGQTWTKTIEVPDHYFNDLSAVDPLSAWAAGDMIQATTDGGVTWLERSTPADSSNLTAIELVSPRHAVVVDVDAIHLTKDRGETWIQRYQDDDAMLVDLQVLEGESAWAVGLGNRIVHTTRGTDWTTQNEQYNLARNVVATLDGSSPDDSCYIVCAHYDAISDDPFRLAPGADDNASGVAGVLEVARILSDQDVDYDIKFILWTLEEQGLIGSMVYAMQAAEENAPILGVVNMDMIAYEQGAPPDFDLDYSSASRDLAEYFMGMAGAHSEVPFQKHLSSGGGSDHVSFWDQGFQAVGLAEDRATEIWGGSNPYYHTTLDLIDHLSFPFMREGVRASVAAVAGLALNLPVGIADGAPPARTDLALHQNAPNPFNPSTLIAFEIPESPAGELPVRLTVYDLRGAVVQELVKASLPSGRHWVRWDGCSQLGVAAPSGVYLYRLEVAGESLSRRMLLVE